MIQFLNTKNIHSMADFQACGVDATNEGNVWKWSWFIREGITNVHDKE
jgi:hypothetical protein